MIFFVFSIITHSILEGHLETYINILNAHLFELGTQLLAFCA